MAMAFRITLLILRFFGSLFISRDWRTSDTAGVPWLRSYFRLVQELSGGQNEKRP